MAIIRVPRFKKIFAVPRSPGDGLDAFGTEASSAGEGNPSALETPPPGRTHWTLVGVVALGVIAAAASAALAGKWGDRVFAVAAAQATFTISTVPASAEVTIDGETKGRTPFSTTLLPGVHQVKLTSPIGLARAFDVTVRGGESLVHHVEWTSMPSPPTRGNTGSLHVQTDVPGPTVMLDDVERGRAPLTLSDVPIGEHRLVVRSDTTSYRRTITIKAGETLAVVVAPPVATASAGWLRVLSPVTLDVRSRGDLVGNSESDRIMLPVGDHQIVMSNEALGFSRTQVVKVTAGGTTEVRVSVPQGLLSVNAIPWADVWVGDERIGVTPLANISRPIGTYRVTLRHPQLGERHATITVSTKETARLGVDMRQR